MSKKVLLVVTAVLFLGAVIGVIAGFSVPGEKQEQVTHLTYDIEGIFDHQAYEKPAPEKQPNPKYFMKIIDSIDVYYSYQFLTAEPVTRVTEQVVISAVVSIPGTWEKEVIIVPKTEQSGAFTISFPFKTSDFFNVAGNVTEEIGIGKGAPTVLLKASVHTVARTAAGVLEDDFVQTVRVKLAERTLEWGQPLTLSEMRYAEGLKYEHWGNFSYAINLKPNILYGAVIMEPEIPPPPGDPVPLKSSESYKSETIDRIEGTFAYKVESSEPLSQVINEVEVTAMVGEAEGRHETFIVVPRRQETDDFTVDFLLDVPLFYAVGRSIEKETGGTASTNQLTITADVHTTAQSEFGPVDETFSQSLRVTLGPDKVLWPVVDPTTKSGSIEETLVISNPAAGTARIVSLGALGMMAVALFYAIWSYWEFKRKWISRLEADAIQVRNKHQDLVVDVEKLPDIADEETVIELGSLGELTKAADGLLKPVLRLTEPERHVYCIIDGTTRYQYVSLRQQYVSMAKESAAPPIPEPPTTDKTKPS